MAGVSNKASLIMKERGKPFGVYGGILDPLKFGEDKLGVTFPFTPTIMMSHSSNYGTYDVTGSIYQQNYYMNTPNPTMSITAMFPSNTEKEAYYTAAALHFFKSCTKSDFGVQAGDRAGTPPPILKFNCYGHVHASNVPVVIRSFNYTLPEDTDYVEIDIEGEMVAIPTLVLAAIELTPQLPPKQVKDNFNIKTFASGGALKGGNSGGFI
jgi:hypothetical protein